MIYAEPEAARRRTFPALLAYALRQSHAAGSLLFMDTPNLMPGGAHVLAEVAAATARALALAHRGRKPDGQAFHFILSWHRDDRPTEAHMIETARSALAALGLAEHQAVIAGHDDTEQRHAHVVANVLHPLTGKAAPLGWRWRTMSRWAAAYEQAQGVIRCHRRGVPKAANESRKRVGRKEWERRQRAGEQLASPDSQCPSNTASPACESVKIRPNSTPALRFA